MFTLFTLIQKSYIQIKHFIEIQVWMVFCHEIWHQTFWVLELQPFCGLSEIEITYIYDNII